MHQVNVMDGTVWCKHAVCMCEDVTRCLLTGFVYRGKHSRTPPPHEGQLEEEWHRTRTGCVCRCDRPCECTDPSLQGHPRKACSPGSPLHCPPRSSLLCFFSARQQKDVVEVFTSLELITFCDIINKNFINALLKSRRKRVKEEHFSASVFRKN